ncbi:hypothetical protein [Metallibacterium sp.]|uniref:hypothetical protein n=1 Tax=Metallibacterium sp. TaxID=2940281 RepID=UPI0026288485|nr:hypothetical protein [Metallibacterium sp.]
MTASQPTPPRATPHALQWLRAAPVLAWRNAAHGAGVHGIFLRAGRIFRDSPVRDRPGAALGSIPLPWFYLTISIVMLTLVPVFGWAVARFRRRRLLGAVHGLSR